MLWSLTVCSGLFLLLDLLWLNESWPHGAGAFVFQFIDDFMELLKAIIPLLTIF